MCPRCSAQAYTVGARCATCGYFEGEPPEKPEPEGPDPVGPDRELCCRYCSGVFPSAQAVADHQEARHPGVGSRLVTDAREWWEAGG